MAEIEPSQHVETKSATVPSFTPPTLSSLAPEIRLQIYGHLMPRNSAAYYKDKAHHEDTSLLKHNLSILASMRVSKQIYSEAKQHFWSQSESHVIISAGAKTSFILIAYSDWLIRPDRALGKAFKGVSIPRMMVVAEVMGFRHGIRHNINTLIVDEEEVSEDLEQITSRLMLMLQTACRIGVLHIVFSWSWSDMSISKKQLQIQADRFLPWFKVLGNIEKIEVSYKGCKDEEEELLGEQGEYLSEVEEL